MAIEERLQQLGLVLPAEPAMPPGVKVSFSWARVVGSRVLVSGHGAQSPDGTPQGPFGRVPDQVSLDQAQVSARSAALSVISSVRYVVGDLDRVQAWLSVTGFVNAEPGYPSTTAVPNAFSDLQIDTA